MHTQKKKILFFLGMSVFILVGLFSFSTTTFADTKYTSLAPIGTYVKPEFSITPTSFNDYLNNMFKLGIALCTALAVLMIIVGGIQYASSDAWSKKSDGKERIFAALTGLVIALGSWALLNTIDPRLVSTALTLKEVKIEGIETMTPRPEKGTGTDRQIGTVKNTTVDPNAKIPQEDLNQHLLGLLNNSKLPSLSPQDAAKYFPNGATPEAWAKLFAGIIKKESNFNSGLTYTESFKDRNGNNVISTGLMQISQESARAYGFPNITTEQLKDPKTNLEVGVAIMQKWVEKDGCISCKDSNGNWRGGARYWSTLR
jgi:hypothetical protein